MSDFLRLLAPRHADALRPAAPLRALATPIASAADTQAPAREPDAPGIAPPRFDLTKSRTTGMQEKQANVPPQETRERMLAMDPASVVPGVERHPAVGAMPPDPPPFPRNDNTGSREGPSPRAVAPAIPPVVHDQPALERSPAQHAREQLLPPAPLPRSMPKHLAAPLSATAVALLAPAMAPTAPPAIHISIDRIEVRAPAQPAKQALPRPRAVPQPQDLHDYLRRKPSP